ncbi:MAG: hypothetical protein ONB17_03600 [candidate division KSB1 bacterium]|nr:hypothetical protein [candidate division KSB1 bacterium]MDZ7294229.1 hypothetical protein [candidate division KSB1 bacterium]
MCARGLVSLATLGVLMTALRCIHPGKADPHLWTTDFQWERPYLTSTGRNPYFVLEPGWVLELADGEHRLTVTVLQDTIRVDGVWCRIVEERETKGGELVEVSRNYFAISKRSNSVYYFGEDAGGAWQSGQGGARFGLMMPGLPLVGARYYEEIAPGVAMDRAEIVSVSDTITTPAGIFSPCLKILETTPLEPLAREYKWYAPDIGLVQDGSMKLVSYGRRGS